MIDQLEIYLVAFVLSLSHTQLEMLKRDQRDVKDVMMMHSDKRTVQDVNLIAAYFK